MKHKVISGTLYRDCSGDWGSSTSPDIVTSSTGGQQRRGTSRNNTMKNTGDTVGMAITLGKSNNYINAALKQAWAGQGAECFRKRMNSFKILWCINCFPDVGSAHAGIG